VDAATQEPAGSDENGLTSTVSTDAGNNSDPTEAVVSRQPHLDPDDEPSPSDDDVIAESDRESKIELSAEPVEPAELCTAVASLAKKVDL